MDLIQEVCNDMLTGSPPRHGAPTFGARFPRTPEAEAKVKMVANTLLQPVATACLTGMTFSRNPATAEVWAFRYGVIAGIMGLFNDPAAFEFIAKCIWPEAQV